MDKFTKVRNIGKGNMGTCALARNNEDGKYYVIKQVDLTRMNKKERQQSLNEARVLSSLRHPNIINYVDSFLAKKSDHLCIVMEFADGGDMSSRIKKNYGVNFRESQVLDWFIQLVLSLHYVHQRKILHRDVKTQNVFLTSDNIVKLGDFGIARTLSNTYDQAKTFVGTPYYLSPELILERPYDHRSDVWALGVVLYEVLTLKHPFNASDMKGLMQRILKVQYDPIPMIYSAEVRDIVPRLLMKDPSRRIELADVLRLPVVQRRMAEWLRGDVVPQKYLDTLIKLRLLPTEMLDRAQAFAHRQEVVVRVASVSKGESPHHDHSSNRGVNAKKPSGAGRVACATESVTGSDDSEGGHTVSNETEPLLPPVSTRQRPPFTAASEEVRTAPPTSYTASSTPRRQLNRLSSDRTPGALPRTEQLQHRQEHEEEDWSKPSSRRVSRQGAGAAGPVGRYRRQQHLPSYKYYRNPSTNVGVSPPLYAARHPRSHLPSTPPPPLPPSSRLTPLPSHPSSLDNFYQQLNYYQQHRSTAVVGSGGGNVGFTRNNNNNNNNNSNNMYSSRQAAGGGGFLTPPPTHSIRSSVVPPVHTPIPATVLSSRKVNRKRPDGVPSSWKNAAPLTHASPALRPTPYNSSSRAGCGGDGGLAYAPAPATEAAGAPDIKAMLQRAAEERAQRRLAGAV